FDHKNGFLSLVSRPSLRFSSCSCGLPVNRDDLDAIDDFGASCLHFLSEHLDFPTPLWCRTPLLCTRRRLVRITVFFNYTSLAERCRPKEET
ncbi:unnamed protein product, partial [Amoebophrya sp. A25]